MHRCTWNSATCTGDDTQCSATAFVAFDRPCAVNDNLGLESPDIPSSHGYDTHTDWNTRKCRAGPPQCHAAPAGADAAHWFLHCDAPWRTHRRAGSSWPACRPCSLLARPQAPPCPQTGCPTIPPASDKPAARGSHQQALSDCSRRGYCIHLQSDDMPVRAYETSRLGETPIRLHLARASRPTAVPTPDTAHQHDYPHAIKSPLAA